MLIEITEETIKDHFDGNCIFLLREDKLYISDDKNHKEDDAFSYMEDGEIGCFVSQTPTSPPDYIPTVFKKIPLDKIPNESKEYRNKIIEMLVNEGRDRQEVEKRINSRMIDGRMEFLSPFPSYKSSDEFFWFTVHETVERINKYRELDLIKGYGN